MVELIFHFFIKCTEIIEHYLKINKVKLLKILSNLLSLFKGKNNIFKLKLILELIGWFIILLKLENQNKYLCAYVMLVYSQIEIQLNLQN